MKFFILLSWGFLSLFILNSCLPSFLKRNKPIVLKIENKSWDLKDLESGLSNHLKNFSSIELDSTQNLSFIKEQYIQNLIFSSLLENWVKKNKLYPKSLSKKLRGVRHQKNLDKKLLKRQKKVEALRAVLHRELLKKIPTPSLKKRKSFYLKNKIAFYQKPRCLIQHMQLPSKELAKRLRQKIETGIPFAKIASLYSPSSKSFWLEETSSSPFANICKEGLKKLSPVLKSDFGWHIARLEKKTKPYQKKFPQVKAEILKKMKEVALKKEIPKWLKAELLQTDIFIDRRLLNEVSIRYKRNKQ